MNGIIAADIGGTNMRIALFNTNGMLIAKKSTFTYADKGSEQTMIRLLDIIIELLNENPEFHLKSIGLSLAGPIDKKTKKLLSPPNLPGWNYIAPEILLRSILTKSNISIIKKDLPIYSQNDVNLAVIGEYEFGIGKNFQNIIFISWGTGVGGGILINGQLLLGNNGFAGEIGHMQIDPNGPLCKCGLIGCLESFVSGSALVKFALYHINNGRSTVLKEIYTTNNQSLSGQDIVDADSSGDVLAKEIIDEAAWNMGRGIASLKNIFDPEIIILGGGISDIYHRFYPILTESVYIHSMGLYSEKLLVIPSSLGSDASIYGAAQLAILNGKVFKFHHD